MSINKLEIKNNHIMSAPILNNFEEALTNFTQIIEYVDQHPDEDVIYKFTSLQPNEFKLTVPDCYIAGSKGVSLLRDELVHVQEKLKENLKDQYQNDDIYKHYIGLVRNPKLLQEDREVIHKLIIKLKEQYFTFYSKEFYGKFTSNDTDLFVLNNVQNHRVNIGELDVVYKSYKTPEELLIHFDLPCCRAARDLNNTFYVSLHCLYSLFTGEVYLPRIYSDEQKYNKVIKDLGIKSRWSKLQFRIAKYEDRGYYFNYYKSNVIPKSLANGFTYPKDDLQPLKDWLVSVGKDYDKIIENDILNLSHLGLTSIPKEIGLLTHLKHLWLSNNKLTNLPEEICHLVNLEKLYLNNNQLTSLPENITNLKKLVILSLYTNPIQASSLRNLTQLTNLII